MARRLAADAKIVLERAGYIVKEMKAVSGKKYILVYNATNNGADKHGRLYIDGGTVDNVEVVKLLNARGFNEHGYKC